MCVFCDIIKRKSPAHIVYENDKLISFLDIEPINEGYSIMQNGGKFCDFGHAHFHVFPRYDNDGFAWIYGNEEKDVNEEIAERIRLQIIQKADSVIGGIVTVTDH